MSQNLHSLSYFSFLHGPSSPDWDLQTLGALKPVDLAMEEDGSSPFLFSLESDFSSGYLEDALIELGDRFKRRRVLFYDDNSPPIKSLWDLPASFDHGTSDEHFVSTSSVSDEGIAMDSLPCVAKSSIEDVKASPKKGLKRMMTRVVYPFDMVKPGGREGDVTLNDINERIMMPPSRPVRHPVGEFACKPCVSPHGTGLSGKAVVAITRIQTRGRGTIRIIRTKG